MQQVKIKDYQNYERIWKEYSYFYLYCIVDFYKELYIGLFFNTFDNKSFILEINRIK